ncbi:MAG: hypothetical protein IJS19_06380 [Muribaculaceae bacterium]|nr:hypothetical protein [Muribaculaceae bacterium]
MKELKKKNSIADTLRGLAVGEVARFDLIDYPVSGLRSTAYRLRKELGYDFTITAKAGIRFTTILRTR